MNFTLEPDIAADVKGLCDDYGYTPGELVSIGLAVTKTLMRESVIGNRVVVIAPNGDLVLEFKVVEPAAIYSLSKSLVESAIEPTDI